MNYSVETTTRFDKEFKKLDSYTKRMIKAWIEKNLIGCTDPRQHGKGLTANRSAMAVQNRGLPAYLPNRR